MHFHIPHSLYTAMVEAQDEFIPLARKQAESIAKLIYFTPASVKMVGNNMVVEFTPAQGHRFLAALDNQEKLLRQEIENGSAVSSKPNHPE